MTAMPKIEEDVHHVHHAALDYSKLRELVKACSIRGEFTEAGYDERVVRALEYFNKYVFVVNGADVNYVHEDFDAEGLSRVVQTYTCRAAFERNWDVFVFSKDAECKSRRPISIAQAWLNWEHRRIYDGEEFHPGRELKPYAPEQENVRNRWTGWEFARQDDFVVDQGLIQVITAHIRDVVCSGSAELYAYVLKYMKLVLDGRKTGVALCLRGEQGVGKSAFVEYFGRKIVGDKYYAHVEGLTGLLKSNRCCKCWVVCDETKRRASPGQAQRLKSIVTKPTREAKNKVDADGYVNLCLVSTSRNAYEVGGKARWCCAISVAAHRKGDSSYFDKLHVAMGTKLRHRDLTPKEQSEARDIARHFFHLVWQQDTTNFRVESFPQTEN